MIGTTELWVSNTEHKAQKQFQGHCAMFSLTKLPNSFAGGKVASLQVVVGKVAVHVPKFKPRPTTLTAH